MKKRVVAACLENHKRDVLLLQEKNEFRRLNLTCEDGQDGSVFCWKVVRLSHFTVLRPF